jgi:hypothetical protein
MLRGLLSAVGSQSMTLSVKASTGQVTRSPADFGTGSLSLTFAQIAALDPRTTAILLFAFTITRKMERTKGSSFFKVYCLLTYLQSLPVLDVTELHTM